ncbi:MAG TPA: hypothetical protein VE153_01145 [Myxococcus sp.]|nr:hypothetical protein [Myxococcus sp.]
MLRASLGSLMACLCVGVLTSCDDFGECAPPDGASIAALPGRLSVTGLFADAGLTVLAEGVRPFTPQFELWSDGATKRRWILLPPGTRIDTRDMDAWRFPQGTRLWKEFTRDGVRVETRLLEKSGPRDEDWRAVAYVWLLDGSDAVVTPEGQRDALGTPHDVPAAADCFGCHGGRESRVLGFSSIQLSHDAPAEAVDLEDLVREGLLSRPSAARYTVPGNDTERAALGYLHANCGHCHNPQRPDSDGPRCYDPNNSIDFWLQVDRLDSVRDTPTYNAGAHDFRPGKPDKSKMIERISGREPGFSMPPLGTEKVDSDAVALLRRWISQMD